MKNDSRDVVVAVMQPYFFPYVGYWQLMAGVDIFVLHKNVKYVKQSWINRNRFLIEGKPTWLTIPLVNGPDTALISQKQIAPQWADAAVTARRKLAYAYSWSDHFSSVMDWFVPLLQFPTNSLYDFLCNVILETHDVLNFSSKIVFEDDLLDLTALTGKDRLLEICRQTGATRYVNLPGGRKIYAQHDFDIAGVKLHFHDPQLKPYAQKAGFFVPQLSLLDLLFSVGFSGAAMKINQEKWTLEPSAKLGLP